MEGGNNLEQSVALVAAANKVVQDPSSVGSALRTISLRLRGTSVEILEEMGEETDNVVESTSKLQAQLKALTGVDILTDTGAYKDTYTILKEIGAEWENISDIDKAAALELMAGKNRANTLSAILSNMKDLEGAYESALKAEGSALKENEAYLDSIQGRIDLFTNALQTFWMNFIDSNVVKGFVDAGTTLVQLLDTIHGKLLVVATAFILYKKFHDGVTFTKMFDGVADVLKDIYTTIMPVIAQTKTYAALTGKLSAAQYLAAITTNGLKTALQGLWNVLKANPIYAIAAAVTVAALAFDHLHTTSQEAADSAKEAFDEINNIVETTKFTIQSLESELSTLQDKIDELDGKELSFADNQELERLKKQREELEHSLKVQEQLLELQRDASNKQAVASMKAYTKAASEGAKETQDAAKNIGTFGGIVAGIAAAAGALFAIPTGGTSLAASTIVAGIAAGGAAGGVAGNKIGEAVGSGISENEGTYDSWYETYTKALETARKEEQKALEDYKKDSSNIDKLDKWQEAQQKASDIETEMYNHLSQMQQYYKGLEYGTGFDDELNDWYNFLDKFSVDQGASGAEVTALDRIFGENASEEIQSIKEQILEAINTGKDFDFEAAINGSQELKSTLEYINLDTEHVKNYFTQVGEEIAASTGEVINSIDTYSAIVEAVSKYNDILAQTSEIIGDNTKVTQEYRDSLIDLGVSEEELNEYFDDNNKLVVKNAKGLKNLVTQNVKLKKSQHQLDYYNLVKQLHNALKGTNQLDDATRDSIYTLLDQIDVVDRAIYQYQLLEDSLLGARNAFDEFAQAQEVDALNTYGDSYVEMAQTMYDALYKNGQVGTEAMWAAIEALVPDSVYQHLTEDADKMKAIYDYYNKNILPTLKLDEDQLSLEYKSIEEFVKNALDAGVIKGEKGSFDLVEGMNLEKASELLGYTAAQTYALFAELDKYNVSGSEPSFLIQLDDSLEGRIMNITSEVEELNRQKLALLEDGGYEKNKVAIDAINNKLSKCDASLEATGKEAYVMWQEYSKNDAALSALSEIKDKQQEITKYSALKLGLEWDEVKGKSIQQVYDEILAKQQELGVPTELSVQFAKEHIDAEIEDLESKLKDKEIDIEANVVWDKKDKQYETTEGSQYANDEDLQRYIELQNEGYALDNYLDSGMTVTEEYLSNIKDILQDIYNYQTGNKNDKQYDKLDSSNNTAIHAELKDISKGGSVDLTMRPMVDSSELIDAGWDVEAKEIATVFTSTFANEAGNVAINFTPILTDENGNYIRTLSPAELQEYAEGVIAGVHEDELNLQVGAAFTGNNAIQQAEATAERTHDLHEEIISKNGAEPILTTEQLDAISSFFTNAIPETVDDVVTAVEKFFKETVPQEWNEFWDSVGEIFDSVGREVSEVYDIANKFFTETIPQAWNEFWAGVGETIDEIGNNATELYGVVSRFFKETIPQKWDEFWNSVDDFLTEDVPYAIGYAAGVVARFFTVTIPEKWDEFWNGITEFYNESIGSMEDLCGAISKFFTETIPEKWNELWDTTCAFYEEVINPVAEDVKQALSKFFNETLPTKWNEFLDDVDQFFTQTIPTAAENAKDAVYTFFTETIPAKWNAFWDSVDQFINDNIVPALMLLQNKVATFFTETIPAKWNEFLDRAANFFTVTIPTALQQFGNKIMEFFTVTLPGKWTAFWANIDRSFITPIATGLESIRSGITTFFTVTLPGKISGIWGSVSSWISKKSSEIWNNVTSGFTAGFGGKKNGGAGANGTAHASGTAHANGSWGAPKTESALVGELGPEMVVRNGRWFTVGENGAEFTDIKKGDIVFNHKQTEDLLSNGYVTGRGKAYASGTAYAGLWTPTSPNKEQSNAPGHDFSSAGDKLYDAADSLQSAAGSISDASDTAKNTVDFIEIRLEEIEATISKTLAKLENYKDNASSSVVNSKNSAYDNLVEAEKNKANTYYQAANVYNQKATALLKQIPAKYREMAKNGAIAIADFVGENETEIADAINEYREWNAKADDAEVGYLEAIAQQAAYRVEQLEDIASDFENILGLIEVESNLIQSEMDLVEESGERLSPIYYNELIKQSKASMKEMQKEKKELQKVLDQSVKSGDVKVGSDEWYEMVNAIADVDEEIVQCKIDIEEFQNAINDLKWDNFDKLISKFDTIDSELSHMYDRFTDDDVVDENGNWNENGIAALGVAAQQMELAQKEAEQYDEAIDELTEDYNNGLYSEDEYNEKLAELKENQWEAIEAYEDAKDAIVDLNKTRIEAVKDGMQEELDAYKELIDKKKEALDAEKDLYDFQKNVAKQQKDIDEIDRKLAALANDNSASARAERARLEAERAEAQEALDDTYYDRSVSQQQEALDKEYEQYEENMNAEMEALDEYLKNEEAVIADSMNTVKANAEIVLGEIRGLSQQYGIEISNAIVSPWNEGANAVSGFSDQFTNAISAFTDQLQSIIDQEKELEEQANKTAAAVLQSTDKNVANIQSATPSQPSSNNNNSSATNNSTTTQKAIKKGQSVTVKKTATRFSSKSSNKKMASHVPGGSYTVMQVSGDQILIGKKGVATGWVKKTDLVGYKHGTLGVPDDQWAWIDEIGEELVLHAGDDGKLSYLTKGTSVIPSNLTERLIDLVADPTKVLENSRPVINAPHVANNEFNINMDIAEVVHIEHVDNDTLPDVTKAVEKQLDKYMTTLNNAIRKHVR